MFTEDEVVRRNLKMTLLLGQIFMVVKVLQKSIIGILEAAEQMKVRIFTNLVVNICIFTLLVWFLGYELSNKSSSLLYSLIICNAMTAIVYLIQITVINWHELSTIRVQYINHELMISRYHSAEKHMPLLDN